MNCTKPIDFVFAGYLKKQAPAVFFGVGDMDAGVQKSGVCVSFSPAAARALP